MTELLVSNFMGARVQNAGAGPVLRRRIRLPFDESESWGRLYASIRPCERA
jgi:hypothetical protein